MNRFPRVEGEWSCSCVAMETSTRTGVLVSKDAARFLTRALQFLAGGFRGWEMLCFQGSCKHCKTTQFAPFLLGRPPLEQDPESVSVSSRGFIERFPLRFRIHPHLVKMKQAELYEARTFIPFKAVRDVISRWRRLRHRLGRTIHIKIKIMMKMFLSGVGGFSFVRKTDSPRGASKFGQFFRSKVRTCFH